MARLMYLLPLLLGMVACGAQPQPTLNVPDIVHPTFTAIVENNPQVVTPQTSPTTIVPPAAPGANPTTIPDACPAETADLKLLVYAEEGYCFLYPAEHTVLPPRFIVINPHNASGDTPGDAWLGMVAEAAANRTAAQAADSRIAQWGGASNITRNEILVDGMQAVVVDGLPGPDPVRNVFMVANDRMYMFYFMPWAPNASEPAPIENLYAVVMDTLHFLAPTTPSP